MSSYIDSNLLNDEKVLYRGKLSIWCLMKNILLGLAFILLGLILIMLARWILIGAIAILVGFIFWFAVYLIYISTEMAVTDKRVMAKKGVIKRETVEMFLTKVESIKVDQGILGRIFNFGSVIIKGTGGDAAPFDGIANPLRFRKEFMSAADVIQSKGWSPISRPSS
ncbi:MAG: PH domain-containing protein [Gammaproteobacteria bacterium]